MVPPGLGREFHRLLGQEQVLLDETHRHPYANAAAARAPVLAAVVLRPKSPEELGQVVRRRHEHQLPLAVRVASPNHILHPGKVIGA